MTAAHLTDGRRRYGRLFAQFIQADPIAGGTLVFQERPTVAGTFTEWASFRLSPARGERWCPWRQPCVTNWNRITQAPEGRKNMSHTYTNLLTHVIFSTKDRAPLITAPLHDDLLTY